MKVLPVCLVSLIIAGCSTFNPATPAPKHSVPIETVAFVETLAFNTTQTLIPDALAVKISNDLPKYKDVWEPGGWFAPRPKAFPTCYNPPDYFPLAGVPNPFGSVIMQSCVEVEGTVTSIEEQDGPWWHSTYYLKVDKAYLNPYSSQIDDTIKVEMPKGTVHKFPQVGQRVKAQGVMVIDLYWGFPALLNGEQVIWKPL